MRPASRGAVFWRAALLTAGLMILAAQAGYISEAILSQAARFWPLILIGAGVAILFAGALGSVATALGGVLLGVLVGGLIAGGSQFSVGCGVGTPGPLEVRDEGRFQRSGPQVSVSMDCVELEVVGGSGRAWSVEANPDMKSQLVVGPGDRELEVRTEGSSVVGLAERGHVRVTIPRKADVALDVSVNAGDTTLDLTDGRFGSVEVDANAAAVRVDLSDADAGELWISLNAGSAGIQVSNATRLGTVRLSANAGEIHLCTPSRVGLRVTFVSDVAVGHNLDEEGLVNRGDVWETPGYASAETQLDITYDGNAAALTLNPDGGCS